MNSLTRLLRDLSVWFWSLGLGLVVFDFFSFPILEWRASISYIFFSLAGLLTVWAEKREFGSRVFLYRLHDAVIYSPWKYFLLYFLWISLFSPFTERPIASLVYASNGWLSLFAVGVSAQFIFCERSSGMVVLLPQRLGQVFFIYAFTVLVSMGNSLVHLFTPDLPMAILVNGQVGLFLYFSLGLPFLLWDFQKDGRRMLPRWLSGATVFTGAVHILLVGKWVYYLPLGFVLVGMVSLFVMKRIRPKNFLLMSLGAGVLSLGATLLVFQTISRYPIWDTTLKNTRLLMEARMTSLFSPAWEHLMASNFMGKGIGVTNLHGVWARLMAEGGGVGVLLYFCFFLSLARNLYGVRHSERVVVSNVSLVSMGVFLFFLGHYVENPYSASVWVWYAIWSIFASTPKKRKLV